MKDRLYEYARPYSTVPMMLDDLAKMAKLFGLSGLAVLTLTLVVTLAAFSTIQIGTLTNDDFRRVDGGNYTAVLRDAGMNPVQIKIRSVARESIDFDLVISDEKGDVVYNFSSFTDFSDVYNNERNGDLELTFRILSQGKDMDDLHIQVSESGFEIFGFCCLGAVLLLLFLVLELAGVLFALGAMVKYYLEGGEPRKKLSDPEYKQRENTAPLPARVRTMGDRYGKGDGRP